MNAKLPNGPVHDSIGAKQRGLPYGIPNVTLIGTSILFTDQAAASLDYDLNKATGSRSSTTIRTTR